MSKVWAGLTLGAIAVGVLSLLVLTCWHTVHRLRGPGPEPSAHNAGPLPHDVRSESPVCALFAGEVSIVAETDHRTFSGPWGAWHLFDLAEACGRPVDCVFLERSAELDFDRCRFQQGCQLDGNPAVFPYLVALGRRGGAQVLGVDLPYAEVRERCRVGRSNRPPGRSHYQDCIVDRNVAMVERMVQAKCERGILVVGAGHVYPRPYDAVQTIPALLADVGVASTVFEARCIRSTPELNFGTHDPPIRIVPAEAQSYANWVLEGACTFGP